MKRARPRDVTGVKIHASARRHALPRVRTRMDLLCPRLTTATAAVPPGRASGQPATWRPRDRTSQKTPGSLGLPPREVDAVVVAPTSKSRK